MTGKRIIVVGAGIAGLSAAYRLRQQGFDVTVLESEPAVGGKMVASRRDGFTINRGAALLPGSYREFVRLAAEVGVQLRPLDAAVGVVHRARIHRLRASGLGALVDGVRTPLLSPRSKLLAGRLVVDALRARPRLALDDPAGRAATDVESVGQYCDRRLNSEIRDNVVQPLLHGLFLADAMSASVTDLFFVLTRMLGAPLYGTPAGLDFLCKALADRLDVRTTAQVTAVERLPTGARVSWQHNGTTHQDTVDGCVITVPGPVAAKIYPDLDDDARAIITDRLVHVDAISARFALRRAPDLDCLAVVVPASECGGLATVVQEHLSAPDCVPAGKGLLATFWSADWYAERMHLDDESIAQLMLADLEQVVPGVTDTVEFTVIDRWSPSNPMFRPGNHRLAAELGTHLDPSHRVQLAGDYFGLPIIEGSVVSGRDAATRLGAAIRSRAGASR